MKTTGPVKCYIINRDRLTWLKSTVSEIIRFGGEPVVLDSASSYPPLLEWYASSEVRVIRLDTNLGSRSPWLSGVVDREVQPGEHYVVTDPDLDLTGVPSDVLSVLARGLDQHGVTKAGLSLELNDVPRELLDVWQPIHGKTLEQCEIRYWQEKLDEQFWDAPIDTTFALYKHGAEMQGADFYKGVRSDRPYTAKHLPWYRKDFDEEDTYYAAHREKMNGINGVWYDAVEAASQPPVDFVVLIAQDDAYTRQCFADAAKSISDSLRALGYTVAEVVGENLRKGRPIVFGCNVLGPDEVARIPKDAIIYQLEQLDTDHWLSPQYLSLLRSREVWDFSQNNTDKLRALGCSRLHICRTGFSPNPVFPRVLPKDLDVLFLGYPNARRAAILDKLKSLGLKVHDSFAWGEERRDLVARAKVILNVHYFSQNASLEMVRLGPMLEQGAFIVSESGVERAIEDPFVDGGMVIRPYEQLVDTVVDYLNRPNDRESISRRGTEIYRQRPQKDEVERCLNEMKNVCVPTTEKP